jgi:hypothetical protein
VATAPDSTDEAELFWQQVARNTTECMICVHDAESAEDLPRLRKELYYLRDYLNKVLA